MISDRLKTETRPLHDRTEARFNSAKIFDGDFNLDDYRKLLLYNYLLLHQFEDRIFSQISDSVAKRLTLERRRKLALIETDLKNLNIELPQPQSVTAVNNEAEYWGIFYVIEGSTLGGNMIAKQLAKNSAFGDVAFSYFRCYGENTGSLWKNFKEVLDAEVKPEQYGDCIAGANKAYSFLLNLPD